MLSHTLVCYFKSNLSVFLLLSSSIVKSTRPSFELSIFTWTTWTHFTNSFYLYEVSSSTHFSYSLQNFHCKILHVNSNYLHVCELNFHKVKFYVYVNSVCAFSPTHGKFYMYLNSISVHVRELSLSICTWTEFKYALPLLTAKFYMYVNSVHVYLCEHKIR